MYIHTLYVYIHTYAYIHVAPCKGMDGTLARALPEEPKAPNTRILKYGTSAAVEFEGNSQCLAKSSPYAGPSACAELHIFGSGTFRKWHVWCLRVPEDARCAPCMNHTSWCVCVCACELLMSRFLRLAVLRQKPLSGL